MDGQPATKLEDALPACAFVPFDARRLSNAWLAYQNKYFATTDEWLDRFAYLIPSEIDDSASFLPQRKRFVAERYGGVGLLGHGGGVRVGLCGDYEVKGIGTNPLCDSGTPSGEWAFWHSHGGLALVDAVQEAVWGEVLTAALPFGATRVAAIIGTGTQCWHKTTSGQFKAPRGLAVREAALRPAHFFRAPFFRPSKTLDIAPDAVRVAAAINRLPNLLPQSAAESELKHIAGCDRLTLGLREVARRCAEQCAAARAKRLMHGALSASNIALDGRWLDLGATTALPNYANTHNLGWASHLPTFWEDHLPFIATLRDMCFYIRKYMKHVSTDGLDSIALREYFLDTYERAIRRNFLKLAGVPTQFCEHLPNVQLDDLAQTMVAVARLGVFRRFLPTVPDLTQYGSNTLGRTLLLLCAGRTDERCYNKVLQVIGNRSLGDKLCVGHRSLMDAAESAGAAFGVKADALRRVILLNTARAAMPTPAFFRLQMYRHCEQIIAEHEAEPAMLAARIQHFIDDTADFARLVLAPEPSTTCVTMRGAAGEVAFDAHANAWRVRSVEGVRFVGWDDFENTRSTEPSLDLFNQFQRASLRALRAS